MKETKIYADEFCTTFASTTEMLEFLAERAKQSKWIRKPTRMLKLVPLEKEAETIEEACEKELEGIVEDTEKNTQLVLKVNKDFYPVRDCAIHTILKRAGINGTGLKKLEKATYAKVVNYCLQVAKGDALIKVADGKVSAVHGGDDHDYCVLDMQTIFNMTKGEKYFAFLDDTFTANKKRLYQFCDYLKQANMNIIWRCDSRTDILSKEMIDKMQEVGCTSVHIGIESGSQDVINKINKHISLERSEELLAYMSQKGLQVMCSFIIGHHCDTHETIKETIDMALKFRKKYKATVGISINTPFPGTYLYNHMKDLGINLEIKNWSSFDLVQAVFSTPNITRAELQNYYYEIQSMVI